MRQLKCYSKPMELFVRGDNKTGNACTMKWLVGLIQVHWGGGWFVDSQLAWWRQNYPADSHQTRRRGGACAKDGHIQSARISSPRTLDLVQPSVSSVKLNCRASWKWLTANMKWYEAVLQSLLMEIWPGPSSRRLWRVGCGPRRSSELSRCILLIIYTSAQLSFCNRSSSLNECHLLTRPNLTSPKCLFRVQ